MSWRSARYNICNVLWQINQKILPLSWGVGANRSQASERFEKDYDQKKISWDRYITILYLRVRDREIVYDKGVICGNAEMTK